MAALTSGGRRAPWSRRARRLQRVFCDIWCQFASFGPAPHFYQRGERVGRPVCTIHGHYPDYLVVGPAAGSEVPGTGPTLSAYT